MISSEIRPGHSYQRFADQGRHVPDGSNLDSHSRGLGKGFRSWDQRAQQNGFVPREKIQIFGKTVRVADIQSPALYRNTRVQGPPLAETLSKRAVTPQPKPVDPDRLNLGELPIVDYPHVDAYPYGQVTEEDGHTNGSHQRVPKLVGALGYVAITVGALRSLIGGDSGDGSTNPVSRALSSEGAPPAKTQYVDVDRNSANNGITLKPIGDPGNPKENRGKGGSGLARQARPQDSDKVRHLSETERIFCDDNDGTVIVKPNPNRFDPSVTGIEKCLLPIDGTGNFIRQTTDDPTPPPTPTPQPAHSENAPSPAHKQKNTSTAAPASPIGPSQLAGAVGGLLLASLCGLYISKRDRMTEREILEIMDAQKVDYETAKLITSNPKSPRGRNEKQKKLEKRWKAQGARNRRASNSFNTDRHNKILDDQADGAWGNQLQVFQAALEGDPHARGLIVTNPGLRLQVDAAYNELESRAKKRGDQFPSREVFVNMVQLATDEGNGVRSGRNTVFVKGAIDGNTNIVNKVKPNPRGEY